MPDRFELPTLVTLTAPSCAGKSYLLEELVSQLGFIRLISTTDRAPRAGEVEGLHYFFLSTEESKAREARGEFAELVNYNGVRYGVTHDEMSRKMVNSSPPIVILEPNGLEIYRKYCNDRGWKLFSIFVSAPESVRMDRLVTRTASDIVESYEAGGELDRDAVYRIIEANNKRVKAVCDQERNWFAKAKWDVIVDGTDMRSAIESIKHGIANRNARTDVYE